MRRLPLMTPSIARGAELPANEVSPAHSASLSKTWAGLAAPGRGPAMTLLQSQGLYPLELYPFHSPAPGEKQRIEQADGTDVTTARPDSRRSVCGSSSSACSPSAARN